MGLKTSSATDSRKAVPAEGQGHRQRFGQYFPRLFAYVRPWVGSDAQARDIAVDTFARAFSHPGEMSDPEFAIVLFGLAREACHGRRQAAQRPGSGLTAREREVLGLVFDAQLGREEVARLLRIEERDVVGALVQGLKKLRSGTGSAQALAFQP